MPKFKVRIERTYTITEGFDRVIEASGREEALAAGANLCSEFDQDCPDDCSEDERGYTETGDFEVDKSPLAAAETTEEPDYVVLVDGQCVPAEERGDAEA